MKNEIDKMSSEVLAAHVVVYRVLGMNKEFSLLCMKELVNRRKNGDDFQYEEYIDTKITEFPQPKNMNLLNISNEIKKHINNIKK